MNKELPFSLQLVTAESFDFVAAIILKLVSTFWLPIKEVIVGKQAQNEHSP